MKSLKFIGLLICLFYGWNLLNENGGLPNGFDPSRLEVIDFNLGIGEGNEYGILPMILGGFFLYVSYCTFLGSFLMTWFSAYLINISPNSKLKQIEMNSKMMLFFINHINDLN